MVTNNTSINFWFEDKDQFINSGFNDLVDYINEESNQLLPVRYDVVEPLKYKLADHGLEHFKQLAIEDDIDDIIWKPKAPFRGITIMAPEVGFIPRGYRCCFISISFKTSELSKKKFRNNIKTLWLKLSRILNVFYSEVRIGNPTNSCWWNGIPKGDVIGRLIGNEYLNCDELKQISKNQMSEHWYNESFDSLENNLENWLKIDISDDIAQQPDERVVIDENTGEILSISKLNNIKYPKIWPLKDDPDRV